MTATNHDRPNRPTLALEPLSSWPYPEQPYERSPFSATYTATRRLLLAEAGHLGARVVVVELDVTRAQLRQDGELRASARPVTGRVRVSLDSRHGPLTYACDRFTSGARGLALGHDWQHNMRAIALGLHALRTVDRYGITRGAEQYTGFLALPAGPAQVDRLAAAEVLAEHAGVVALNPDVTAAEGILENGTVLRAAWRRARGNAHPDVHGGDRAAWDQVEQAARVLGLGGT